jgi:hypothetical protein
VSAIDDWPQSSRGALPGAPLCFSTFEHFICILFSHSPFLSHCFSSFLLPQVVSPDGRKVRRSQPLPDVNLFDIQMRTVVAENLPANPTIESMEALFGAVGKVNMVRICHPEGANSATQSAREAQAKSKDGPSLLVSTRQHAVVEMGSVELADRACLELTDRQNWRSGLQVRPLVRRQGLRKGASWRPQQGDGDGEGSGTEGEADKVGGCTPIQLSSGK